MDKYKRYTLAKMRVENLRMANVFGISLKDRMSLDKEVIEADMEYREACKEVGVSA